VCLYIYFPSMLFRIYWYPTKVLYSTFHTAIEMYIAPPNYFYLNTLVTAVYIMQVSVDVDTHGKIHWIHAAPCELTI